MDANPNSRKGPKAVKVDDDLRRLLNRYVDDQPKVSVAAETLGISISTLSRLLSGRTSWVARPTHRRLMAALGSASRLSETRAIAPSAQTAGEQIGRAMFLDARGDHDAAGRVLSRVAETSLDPLMAMAYRIAAARNAQATGNLERAETLLASVVPYLKGLSAQRFALASVALDLAMVRARRNRVADALLAFDLAEATLVDQGPAGEAFLSIVRQDYLAYALRIGKHDTARRLLGMSERLLRSLDGNDSLAAAMDAWLLAQMVPEPGETPKLDAT